jgi:hypothetical protein
VKRKPKYKPKPTRKPRLKPGRRISIDEAVAIASAINETITADVHVMPPLAMANALRSAGYSVLEPDVPVRFISGNTPSPHVLGVCCDIPQTCVHVPAAEISPCRAVRIFTVCEEGPVVVDGQRRESATYCNVFVGGRLFLKKVPVEYDMTVAGAINELVKRGYTVIKNNVTIRRADADSKQDRFQDGAYPLPDRHRYMKVSV